MNKRFVETTGFTDWVGDQPPAWDETLRDLQSELMANPDAGAVIKGCGGLRKIRIPGRGKGKRGGARVIYLHVPEADWVFFVDVYGKGETAADTPDERKELAALARVFREDAILATRPKPEGDET